RHGRRLHRRGASSPAARSALSAGLPPPSPQPATTAAAAADGRHPASRWWRALGFALPTRNLALRRGADGGCVRCSSCVAAARRQPRAVAITEPAATAAAAPVANGAGGARRPARPRQLPAPAAAA
uniref:Os01g0778700 protein n=1 Tax=Macrostomum lignano TaxID=282301 RepID=A0A1I8FQ01_9PLAT